GQVGLSEPIVGPRPLFPTWKPLRESFGNDRPNAHTFDPELEIVELALPIPSAPLSRLAPNYGVVTVARVASPTRPNPFSVYDLTICRNLALRLGFIIHVIRTA